MRRTAIPAVVLAATLSCSDPPLAPTSYPSATASVARPGTGISFAGIGPNERVVVDFASKGCFHEFALRLVFQGVAGGVELSGEVLSTNGAIPPAVAPRALDQAELAALDRLLSLYRAPTDRWCTNHDTVRISAYTDAALMREERYVDTACVSFEQPGILTFPALAYGARD